MIILNPVFTHNIWGGTRLKTDFGYDIPGNDIGECWGISAHPNGDCTILMGFMKEKPSRNYGTSILNYLGIQTFLNFRFW